MKEKDNPLILVVDDTLANLQVVAEVLSDAGFEVAIATDGERAIKQATISQPDLILLDVMMPGIDGFETCRRLKAAPATCGMPVIFMTALSDTTDKVRGFNLGAVDYVTKPFQEAELLARVTTQLKLRYLHQTLEQQVEQRTTELQTALQQVQQSQVQLVQSEKMAVLGQLVAGVAHEINNPVNFIHGNLTHVQDYTDNLLAFVQLSQQHSGNAAIELQDTVADLDLEFIRQDLPKTLASMKIGTHRICEIVRSLRNFSRLDEADCKTVDIHEGINSTLLILQHRLKSTPGHPEIQIIREYGQLPLVECYAGSLNQVFMNILANAIDALEELSAKRTYQENQSQPSQITIRTTAIDHQWVQVAITDNGSGIPQEIQQRIFDPFFTTKPVGKGTGMGMSISHQIITEKHGGKLTCCSTLGEGAEFVIQIPVQGV
ncbi:hybrid sensor histidine kinase/response regulator [Phormidium sp. FACHB-592]|uniref:histidine kinase n=1 Tax=Stenomitos frigidus AS-A4 TaxID=2933935 RepID=A0ABV0KRX0_9CYAN|nr:MULTISPECIES: response regulator [Cyanophyceae]MBD2034881.1 hybrid sensor histidine kinase/response regulator [Leptolyngbya sp. FACHB-321]MBD2074209.1 hybrid sensor histidine kinase/response regulator [Phormidium sp. FACHB-592]